MAKIEKGLTKLEIYPCNVHLMTNIMKFEINETSHAFPGIDMRVYVYQVCGNLKFDLILLFGHFNI